MPLRAGLTLLATLLLVSAWPSNCLDAIALNFLDTSRATTPPDLVDSLEMVLRFSRSVSVRVHLPNHPIGLAVLCEPATDAVAPIAAQLAASG